MDFKVAGTKSFVTALQLDTKLDGIPSEVLRGALVQARDARFTILEVMNEAIDAPDPMSQFAPRITTIKVPVDKIGEVIGPKGKMINSITERDRLRRSRSRTTARSSCPAPDGESPCRRRSTSSTRSPTRSCPRSASGSWAPWSRPPRSAPSSRCCPGRDGLVHISKLGSGKRIAKVEDVVNVGDKLQVEIAEIDARGKISLVPVAAADAAASATARQRPPSRRLTGAQA